MSNGKSGGAMNNGPASGMSGSTIGTAGMSNSDGDKDGMVKDGMKKKPTGSGTSSSGGSMSK